MKNVKLKHLGLIAIATTAAISITGCGFEKDKKTPEVLTIEKQEANIDKGDFYTGNAPKKGITETVTLGKSKGTNYNSSKLPEGFHPKTTDASGKVKTESIDIDAGGREIPSPMEKTPSNAIPNVKQEVPHARPTLIPVKGKEPIAVPTIEEKVPTNAKPYAIPEPQPTLIPVKGKEPVAVPTLKEQTPTNAIPTVEQKTPGATPDNAKPDAKPMAVPGMVPNAKPVATPMLTPGAVPHNATPDAKPIAVPGMVPEMDKDELIKDIESKLEAVEKEVEQLEKLEK